MNSFLILYKGGNNRVFLVRLHGFQENKNRGYQGVMSLKSYILLGATNFSLIDIYTEETEV